MTRIALLDYGMGNLHSAAKALEHVGATVDVTNDPKLVAQADKIVNDAIEKARRLSFQTEDMKRQSKVFRSRFRMLVEAQLDLLKSEDWDYLLNYDLDAEQVTLEDIHHLNDNDLTPEERAMKESQSQAENNSGTTSTSESSRTSNNQSETSTTHSNL